MAEQEYGWQFWVDCGGTFTDIVAKTPDGQFIVHKLLSEQPSRYPDAVLQGIRDILHLPADAPIPIEQIQSIKMGTTVGTNALLERKGEPTVLVITKGFKDALRIGYQNRPDIFALEIKLPTPLYSEVVEVAERYTAQGEELLPVDLSLVAADLQEMYDRGFRSCAIAFLHAYRYPDHELQVATIAQAIGFTQISLSHQVSPLMKLISRGDTTVVDAYLSPILQSYIQQLTQALLPPFFLAQRCDSTGAGGINPDLPEGINLLFMQSNGGLVRAANFQGKDCILSGPAGGIVGAVQTILQAGFEKIITFDMGGTSTDVAHFAGEYERVLETEIAGVRVRSPMLAIHTVAAGGGSLLGFDGMRYRVGPDSAGAQPGPACYRQGGGLTVTDCNVLVGKLQPEFFPHVFGNEGNLPLDAEIVKAKFQELAEGIGDGRTVAEVAAGFLAIAVDKMANAIKKISLQRGYDVADYALCCFGGAGGQHACAIADVLGMKTIFIHPYAGVLSAYGMGLADVRVIKEQAIEAELTDDLILELTQKLQILGQHGQAEIQAQDQSQHQENDQSLEILKRVHLRYAGTDSVLIIAFNSCGLMRGEFERSYSAQYGFIMPDKALIVEAISVEVINKNSLIQEPVIRRTQYKSPEPITRVAMYTDHAWHQTLVFDRQHLQPGDKIPSPAIIIEPTGTNIIEPGWTAEITNKNHLVLSKQSLPLRPEKYPSENISISPHSPYQIVTADPILLEIFNNLFRSVAEQMGITLQNTSTSVNIKERLDFSCAIFDRQGNLVANAPHIPVHLGSMSESIQSLIKAKGNSLQNGDVYISNNPYNGGTHLPDITVITPVFKDQSSEILFYVASRGHHADIGGITPGSMPPHSQNITEEGILIDNFRLVKGINSGNQIPNQADHQLHTERSRSVKNQGIFQESELIELLTNHPYPARNPRQNIADLQAQIAANQQGIKELRNLIDNYGLATVQAYMKFVQDNAKIAVQRVISQLSNGSFTCQLDDGKQIQVEVAIDPQNQTAKIDFTGTSAQLTNNFNAPKAVVKSAVMYVFRTLVRDDIPLNAGCLEPLEIIIPEGSCLDPQTPAAVVAGNVETSQLITDALYAALGVMAAAQGTMNNFTFGNDQYQYYETICGGAGAGNGFAGADAVHTHMTNSRLTDPEVLEWRFPVLVKEFSRRSNSGGSGKYPGGAGIVRSIQFLIPMTAGILSGRRIIPPHGLRGGSPGLVGKNWVTRKDGTILEVGGIATVEMEVGDVLSIATPGGGGYGNM